MDETTRDRATHPRYGDQTACKVCGADIEYHGTIDRWLDRGGNRHCDTSGMARRDENGVAVPYPHKLHKPVRDKP